MKRWIPRISAASAANRWITSTPSASTRTGAYYVGCRFTPARAITVTALSRWVISGNNQSHALSIRRVSDNALMGTVTVNCSGAPSSAWLDGAVSIALASGTQYRVYSNETANIDQWMNADGAGIYTVTADATMDGPDYSTDETTWYYFGSAGNSYTPASFTNT